MNNVYNIYEMAPAFNQLISGSNPQKCEAERIVKLLRPNHPFVDYRVIGSKAP